MNKYTLKKTLSKVFFLDNLMVRLKRLELLHRKVLDPKSSASAIPPQALNGAL